MRGPWKDLDVFDAENEYYSGLRIPMNFIMEIMNTSLLCFPLAPAYHYFASLFAAGPGGSLLGFCVCRPWRIYTVLLCLPRRISTLLLCFPPAPANLYFASLFAASSGGSPLGFWITMVGITHDMITTPSGRDNAQDGRDNAQDSLIAWDSAPNG